MISDFKRYYRAFKVKTANGNMNIEEPPTSIPIPRSIMNVKAEIEKAFSNSFDLEVKVLGNNSVLIAYLDGLVDKLLISDTVVKPINELIDQNKTRELNNKGIAYIRDRLDVLCNIKELDDFNECINSILSGNTLIFIDGEATALNINQQKFEKRSIDEPQTENVVRGPREGFIEVLAVNITLIRRKLKDSNLVFEILRIGRQTKTNVAFCYIKGLANEEIINEVRKRLNNINVDAILESGYIEEYVEDSPFSIFPTVGHSERPDKVAGKLLEGRVAILCDGTPFVLTVPHLFVENLQSSEDYYNRWVYSPFIRLTRLIAVFIATMLPAYYDAFVCFHHDVIPFKLLLTIASSSEGIPFPPLIECLILIIMFQLIREGGIRMPRSLGQAISIVGALIIGQAAVQAGLVSTPAVIIVATTSICSFITPEIESTTFIMRLFILFAANIVGVLGVVLSSLAFFVYMCSLKSFGVPYFAPIAPIYDKDFKDMFIRMPIWSMLRKPESITRRYDQNNNPK